MKYSVLMSVYKNDDPEYLKIALNSIYEQQTRKPDEIVVVFDGPLTDKLYTVLEIFKTGKEEIVKYFPQNANKGLGEALRIGSTFCTGDYVFRMDSGDISDPQRFEKQISYIEAHPEIDVLGTDIAEFNQSMLWIHLPHVINGRTCYGGDIDLFDKIIGLLRTRFDDNIYISSDHGNMDGYKGKFCYGFDVYESAIAIPLITPRINALREIDWLVSNVDIKKIIFERSVPHRDVIYCDTAYYAQPNRKLCIIKDNFKYIYNKKNKKEELYDLKFDSGERCNLMSDQHYDVDRYLMTNTREIFFSPVWDELPQVRNEMQALKDDIWKQASLQVEIYERFISEMKKIVVSIRTRLK